ncbi:MAG TPA: RdgB/HAM1 family non-canonical purine NTP pyrophosphatase [Candidatus Atribacteria bacterium]|nr:RdgB/HAM1 family non-canonical purine NTP pyrophosphatase [Candidatus Atribacteria bacterium]
MKVVLATSNQGKVAEMSSLLKQFGFDVVAQSEFKFSDAIEDGLTFVENAIIKARHATKHTGLPAIADDSGLEVEYLQGAPGIYSARYAYDGCSSAENNKKLLQNMQGVENRKAMFRCCLVMLKHEYDPTPIISEGKWEGRILTEPQGINGFGYDPIFYVPSHKCSAAELDKTVKKTISHRGLALAKLEKLLINQPV